MEISTALEIVKGIKTYLDPKDWDVARDIVCNIAEQSQEIRNWPEKREEYLRIDSRKAGEQEGFNEALSLCASVVRGNLMTVEEIEHIIYTDSNQGNLDGSDAVTNLAQAIHKFQHSKMFGEGK